jgi:thioredoxin reductase (NADPH)
MVVDDAVAFPTLDPDEIAVLEDLGTRRPMAAGEYLYREGDATYDFYVVLSGEAEIVFHPDEGDEQLITRHGPGRFLGELNLLTGMRAYVSSRAVSSGEVLVVPAAELRHVLATRAGLGDKILQAFMARRAILVSGSLSSLRLVGSHFSHEAREVREFLARSRIPFEWIDSESDAAVESLLSEAGVDIDELPVVLLSGDVLRNPTPGALASYLGLTIESIPERCFDLVVIGAGPAGLAASVYGASEGLRTLGVEMALVGGQAGSTSRIENYLGFPTGISGGDLAQRAFVQAEKFGAHLSVPCVAASLREEGGHLVVSLSDGTDVAGRAVIVASGARYRRLPLERLDEFEGNGVYYAATEIERHLCASEDVVIVGGGNSAGQAALYLAEAGSRVTLVIRGSDLGKSMSRYLIDRIDEDKAIVVQTESQVTRLGGGEALSSLTLKGPEGETEVPCVALFSFIGADPSSQWLCGCAATDSKGFVLTDRAISAEDLDGRWDALGRPPLPFETSYPGLFAVGDVRSGSTKRVAAAVGEGSAAVRSVHEYLAFGN